MNDYFETHFDEYRKHIDDAQYAQAIDACLDLLADYKANHADYDAQHKGSPFYVMGYAAFASHDYSGASLFFDAGVSEDLKAFGARADKPALNFLQLLDQGQEVLASGVIRDLIVETQNVLDDYNARPGGAPLTLDELRTRFLSKIVADPKPEKRALVTTFLSFVAEGRYRRKVMDLVSNGSRDPFLVHLFRGCVLFESLLKENPTRTPKNDTLGGILSEMKVELGGDYGNAGSSTFGDALMKLAAGQPIEDTVKGATRLRNTTGHKVSWETTHLDPASYDLAIKTVASACLHVISKLYV